MRLYSGPSSDFIKLNIRNQMADMLREAFFRQNGYMPSQNEVMSWRNSLLRVANLFQEYDLTSHGIIVEHQLPMTSRRIDILVCGHDAAKTKQAVIVELKQWERCTLSDYDSEYVVTWVGGGNRNVLHPAVQVGNYKYYLEYNQSAFHEGDHPIKLSACSYLHNYTFSKDDVLLNERFKNATDRFPVFSQEGFDDLGKYLSDRLSEGNGLEILKEIEQSKYRPSKKLLQHVSTVVKEKLDSKDLKVFAGKDDYVLLDDQLIVYDNVISIVRKGLLHHKKFSVIVKGGPGTGKSVVALKLLADLANEGRNAQYATGSRSFTQTLRKIIKIRGNSLFKYFMSFGDAQPNEIDVLIMDEAHRIREETGYPFKKTGRKQVEDLIRAAKVSVFFIDDFQSVRSGEIGSINYIRQYSESMGCQLYEYELESQFRCGGSDGYINWINSTLHIQRTANALWKQGEEYEFKIFKNPQELEAAILEKVNSGQSARLTAGFCWKWSKELGPDGTLIKDVQIGDFQRPWNAPPDMKGLPKSIPASDYWAYDPNGSGQVGCIYTAQGFEFDYVGVIIGKDLVYRFDKNQWIGQPENSFDGQVKSQKPILTSSLKILIVFY